jgi:RES domain
VGNIANPLGFTPPELCSWEGRFDDPGRTFRTLYCAEKPLTCLREKLADFRPSLKTLKEFGATGLESAFSLPSSWRATYALAPAAVRIHSGDLINIDDPGVRRDLETELRDLMFDLGVEHLDMGEIQGGDRRPTQAIAQTLYRWGAAGVAYRSKLDNEICLALFETRAELLPSGEIRKLIEPLPELENVCREFRLSLVRS